MPLYNSSVVEFGALGNGVADDRTAIQAAIDACAAAGGGRVIFPRPPVRYQVGRGLYLKSGVILEVPDPATVIYCTGTGVSSPYNVFATKAAVMVGSYIDRNVSEVCDLLNFPVTGTIAVGAITVTLVNAGDVTGFAAGDVVGVRDINPASGGGTYPKYMELNIVEAVNVGTKTLTLRYPVYRAIATPSLTRFNNTGYNYWPSGVAAERTPDPHFIVRDAGINGGTWQGPNDLNGPIALAGAVDCRFTPARVIGRNSFTFGNMIARCTMECPEVRIDKSLIELAAFSHGNDIRLDRCVLTGNWSERLVYLPGALRNRIKLGDVSSAYGLDECVRLPSAGHNHIQIGTITAPSAETIIRLISSNEEITEGNTVMIGESRIPTQNSYILSSTFGDGSRDPRHNLIRDCRFYGVVAGNTAFDLEGGTENTFRDLWCEDGGPILTGVKLWRGNTIENVRCQTNGWNEPGGQLILGNNSHDIIGPRPARQDLAARVFWQQSVTDASPFSKTVTLPADTMASGDVLCIDMMGRATGSGGTKTVSVTFNGVTIGTGTITAGTNKQWRLTIRLVAHTNTVGYGLYEFQEAGLALVTAGFAPAASWSDTAYDVVLSGTAAVAGDTLTITRAALSFAAASRGLVERI